MVTGPQPSWPPSDGRRPPLDLGYLESAQAKAAEHRQAARQAGRRRDQWRRGRHLPRGPRPEDHRQAGLLLLVLAWRPGVRHLEAAPPAFRRPVPAAGFQGPRERLLRRRQEPVHGDLGRLSDEDLRGRRRHGRRPLDFSAAGLGGGLCRRGRPRRAVRSEASLAMPPKRPADSLGRPLNPAEATVRVELCATRRRAAQCRWRGRRKRAGVPARFRRLRRVRRPRGPRRGLGCPRKARTRCAHRPAAEAAGG